MATKRLFVGVRVNPEEQRDLKEVCKKLRVSADKKELNVKWSPQENWHITLKFLGEVDEARLPEMLTALDEAAAAASQSTVRASGVGGFPEDHRARVIYAGVSRTQALLDLQSEVEAAYAKHGFSPENRDFSPHVTLARLRSAGSITDLISPFVRKTFDDLHLTEIILFESRLAGNFPLYVPLHRASLNPSQPPSL
jgi:RNA 2',3'-cyclic 3'-phosphodiesterase